jgi:hypothetical protein
MIKFNLISLLSILWSPFSKKNQTNFEEPMKIEPTSINVSLKSNKTKNSKLESEQLQNLIDELNEIEVHILVTAPLKKGNPDIMLSLISEVRLDVENLLIDYRQRKIILTRSFPKRTGYIFRKDHYSIKEILRANQCKVNVRSYTNAKNYSIENSSGYKGICPIFFDQISAENFLIKSAQETLILLRTLPTKSNKEFAKGLLNTKVQTIKLGNLIDYLSQTDCKYDKNKVEFLFVPELGELNNYSKIKRKKINYIIKTKNFAFYQNQFLKIRETSEDYPEI